MVVGSGPYTYARISDSLVKNFQNSILSMHYSVR